MTETEKLKPCPFDGAEGDALEMFTGHDGESQTFNVRCGYCEAEGPMKRTPEESIKAWNQRADQ
jgi:Lar family restriction alleviation protein